MPTSATELGSPLPHRHGDCGSPSHIGPGTGLNPARMLGQDNRLRAPPARQAWIRRARCVHAHRRRRGDGHVREHRKALRRRRRDGLDRRRRLRCVLLRSTCAARSLLAQVTLQRGLSQAFVALTCKGQTLGWIAEDFVPSRADSRRCALSIGRPRPSASLMHVYVPGGSWFKSATVSAPCCFSHVTARSTLCASVSRPSVWNRGSRPVALNAMLQHQTDCQTHARSAKAPQQHHHEHPSLRGAPAQAVACMDSTPPKYQEVTPSPSRHGRKLRAASARARWEARPSAPSHRAEPAPPPRHSIHVLTAAQPQRGARRSQRSHEGGCGLFCLPVERRAVGGSCTWRRGIDGATFLLADTLASTTGYHGVCGPKRTAPRPPCAAALVGATCIPHGPRSYGVLAHALVRSRRNTKSDSVS
jgi:hypothetical protein